jgi:tetratricopeptide (TPR) repeat protein
LSNQSGRYDEAEQAYRRAIEVDPGYAYAWNVLANLLELKKRNEEAEQAYRQAIKIDPHYKYAWFDLARLLEQVGRMETETLEAFFKATELDPGSTWYKNRALKFAQASAKGANLTAALEAVLHLQQRQPEDKEVRFTLAGLLALSGDWTQAKTILEELSTSPSEDDQPDVWAFGAAVKAGHTDEVIRILEKSGSNERWRPLYEALRSIQAGSREYLRRVAPEVRSVAERIFLEIRAQESKQAVAPS